MDVSVLQTDIGDITLTKCTALSLTNPQGASPNRYYQLRKDQYTVDYLGDNYGTRITTYPTTSDTIQMAPYAYPVGHNEYKVSLRGWKNGNYIVVGFGVYYYVNGVLTYELLSTNYCGEISRLMVKDDDSQLYNICLVTYNNKNYLGVRSYNKRVANADVDMVITESPYFDTLINSLTKKTIFPGNNSSNGGGSGTFDLTSDSISIPNLPSLSAVSAGFVTLYTPTISQLNALAAYMWSDAFSLDTFKKLFSDPMDAILGLSIVPVTVPTSSAQNVKIGFIDTGISMNVASSQYVAVDCGTLTPKEYWGSALDYSPYTKFSIYLPYIGTREINADDIMGKTLNVVYHIDILSGALTAMIKCGISVLYEFSGSCACSIPVTGQDFTQLLTSSIQLAGASIAVAASAGSAAGLLPSTANAVLSMKPNIQHTGVVSGAAGMLGVQQPYLIWELPRQSLADGYNQFVGYPSNVSSLIGNLTGYTEVENIRLTGFYATENEMAELESLLKGGFIV